MLSVNPTFKVTVEGEFDFDLGIKLKLPEFEGKDSMEIIGMLLPGPVRFYPCPSVPLAPVPLILTLDSDP